MLRGFLSAFMAILATACVFAIYHSYQIEDGTTLRLISIPLLLALLLAPKWINRITSKSQD